jgi:hypothetical protein
VADRSAAVASRPSTRFGEVKRAYATMAPSQIAASVFYEKAI